MKWISLALILVSAKAFSYLPESHTNLLPYVQEAPDQGDTATCLFQGSTGAVELLLNQKFNIRYPNKGDIFDLSERFAISHKVRSSGHWIERVLPKFNQGWAIHINELPFSAYNSDGSNNSTVWNRPHNFYKLPRVEFDIKVKTTKIFAYGRSKYTKYVVKPGDIEKVKNALVNNNAPVLINYNHRGWWHVVNIVGYDDNAKGECLHTPSHECSGKGAFYVRDSLGKATHLRDYDWFRVNVNTAFAVTLE
jgi:C1A family cysteine protease